MLNSLFPDILHRAIGDQRQPYVLCEYRETRYERGFEG